MPPFVPSQRAALDRHRDQDAHLQRVAQMQVQVRNRTVRAMLLEGSSWGEVAREMGVPKSTAYRYWSHLADAAAEVVVTEEKRALFAAKGVDLDRSPQVAAAVADLVTCTATGLQWSPARGETPLMAANRDRTTLQRVVEGTYAAMVGA